MPRSPAELQEILTKDPELDSIEIEVEVEGGAVTLRGVVDSTDARLAEELVESDRRARGAQRGGGSSAVGRCAVTSAACG